MINAVFTKNGFEISGHSGYSEAGSDIVCAAVSAMTNLTILLLEKNNAELSCGVNDKDNSVWAKIGCVEKGGVVLNALREELEALELEYPKNLRVIKK